MRVRAIDYATNDWLFGKGANDYRQNNDAVKQNIFTRLNSVLGNCFFDLGAGVDWFNLLGSKNQTGLNLAIASTILNTPNVIQIKQISSGLNVDRQFQVNFEVLTTYSTVIGTFIFNSSVG